PTAASSGPGTSSCACSSRSPPGSTAWAACGSTSTAGPATGDRPCASGSPRRSRSSAWWRRRTESSALAGRRFFSAGDLAAPCAGRAAPAFDELLEVLHRLLHVVRHDAEGVAHLFDDGLRLVLHREANPGPVDADGLEAHLARVRRAGGAAPRDDAVGLLPRDLRVPLLLLPRDRGTPVEVRGIELAHFLHAVHEAWEVLELRPLVVGGAHGHADLDRLLGSLHRLLRGMAAVRPLRMDPPPAPIVRGVIPMG